MKEKKKKLIIIFSALLGAVSGLFLFLIEYKLFTTIIRNNHY